MRQPGEEPTVSNDPVRYGGITSVCHAHDYGGWLRFKVRAAMFLGGMKPATVATATLAYCIG